MRRSVIHTTILKATAQIPGKLFTCRMGWPVPSWRKIELRESLLFQINITLFLKPEFSLHRSFLVMHETHHLTSPDRNCQAEKICSPSVKTFEDLCIPLYNMEKKAPKAFYIGGVNIYALGCTHQKTMILPCCSSSQQVKNLCLIHHFIRQVSWTTGCREQSSWRQ